MPRRAVREVIRWLQRQLKTSGKPSPKRPESLPLFGIDGETVPPVPALRASGVHFVIGYLSYPGNPKNLTRKSVAQIHKAGAKAVAVFETTATRARDGLAAGRRDAEAALQQLQELDAPGNAVVYFAVDFDAIPEEIGEYFIGVGRVMKGRTGAYGSYEVLKYLFDHNLIYWGMQTYAWSAGLLDRRACLYQFSNGHILGGISVDYDHARSRNYGGW